MNITGWEDMVDKSKIYNALDNLVVNARFAKRIARQTGHTNDKMLIKKIDRIKEIVDGISKELPQTPDTGTGDTSHGARRDGGGEE